MSTRWVRAGSCRFAVALGAAAAVSAVMALPVSAQAGDQGRGGGVGGDLVPNPAPNAGIPGGSLILDILGWLKYGALAAAVAGLLIGGIAIAVGYTGAHYGASAAGRRWLLGGIGASIIAGLAHSIVVTLYEAT